MNFTKNIININLNKNKQKFKNNKVFAEKKSKKISTNLVYNNIISNINKDFIGFCLYKNNKKIKKLNVYFNK
jgi:hypothetical protein